MLIPNAVLKYPTDKITVCEEISIEVKEIENDGLRGLFN